MSINILWVVKTFSQITILFCSSTHLCSVIFKDVCLSLLASVACSLSSLVGGMLRIGIPLIRITNRRKMVSVNLYALFVLSTLLLCHVIVP